VFSHTATSTGWIWFFMIRQLLFLSLLLCWPPFLHAQNKHRYPLPPPDFFQFGRTGRSVTIAPGDTLTVRFYYNPELNKTVRVREDGKIVLDLEQGVQAAGETPEVLQQDLVKLYSHEFKNPEITVDLTSSANNSVYVTGEVLLPGAKELHGKTTVAMALALSQVSQKTAGTKSVFLIRGAGDGKYSVYKLNASFPHGSDCGVDVAPGDVLFVPRKAIVKADDFMEQYVRQILPATPSASTTVLFTPGNPTIASATATNH
jgi:polysaccharide biosynthesis/export protein PslD